MFWLMSAYEEEKNRINLRKDKRRVRKWLIEVYRYVVVLLSLKSNLLLYSIYLWSIGNVLTNKFDNVLFYDRYCINQKSIFSFVLTSSFQLF